MDHTHIAKGGINPLTYAPQPEINLTAGQLRICARLLSLLTDEQVDYLTSAMQEVCEHGTGDVHIEIRHGKPRFLKRTYLESWWS